jgi:hypothetical protein
LTFLLTGEDLLESASAKTGGLPSRPAGRPRLRVLSGVQTRRGWHSHPLLVCRFDRRLDPRSLQSHKSADSQAVPQDGPGSSPVERIEWPCEGRFLARADRMLVLWHHSHRSASRTYLPPQGIGAPAMPGRSSRVIRHGHKRSTHRRRPRDRLLGEALDALLIAERDDARIHRDPLYSM